MAVGGRLTGVVDFLRNRPKDARRLTAESRGAPLLEERGVLVARQLQCLRLRRLAPSPLALGARPGAEPVREEIGAAVVEGLKFEAARVLDRLLHAVVRREREKEPIPAAQRRAIVEAVVDPDAWRDIVGVVGLVARQPRQEAYFLGMPVGIEVVAHAEVEREAIAYPPVILGPAPKDVTNEVETVVLVREGVCDRTSDRRERLQVPRRGIVPYGKKCLYVGGYVAVPRVDPAHAAAAGFLVVVEAEILAAELQIVTSAPLIRC